MAKSKYDPNTFPLLAEKYARNGLTDKQIAKNLGISEPVYYDYQKKYPKFIKSIKKGKAPVDVEVVNALLKRAKGYEYDEVTVQDGKYGYIKTITKQVTPDVTAQIFWLKNRVPEEWRDVKDHNVEVGNKDEFSHYTDDELREIAAIHKKARGRAK